MTDKATSSDRLTSMVVGSLLAGNGLVIAPAANAYPLAEVLVGCLLRAGVPSDVLRLLPERRMETSLALADQMFHFAVTDLGLAATQCIYERLGVTREDQGQKWLKALISLQEGPLPGEPGYLRLFTLPKTIVIRTLRHGADLDLV